MAANTVREFADRIEVWLAGLRDKEQRGEIMEVEVVPSAEAMRTAARLIAGLRARIEALEHGPQGGGGGDWRRSLKPREA